ncbi:MAG: hypothetical protein AB1782_01280 [Cyanobacteriota bacterium]
MIEFINGPVLTLLVASFIAIHLGALIYVMANSFQDGCLWPVILLLFPFIGFLLYIFIYYQGKKAPVMACYYIPIIFLFALWALKSQNI